MIGGGGGSAPRRHSVMDLLRARFIAGLITIIPIVVTLWAVAVVLGLVDNAFGRVVRPSIEKFLVYIEAPLRLADPLVVFFSLIVAFTTIVAVGWLSRFVLVRQFINLGERIVTKVPFIKFFYVTPKEAISAFVNTTASHKRVVIMEYPRKGVWGVGYATSEMIHQPSGQHLVSVFIPTTPNPTSGFLLLVPKNEVFDINMGMEEAVRFVISGGILAPDSVHIAPFQGLAIEPDLPPPAPLTIDLPTEALPESLKGQDDPPR